MVRAILVATLLSVLSACGGGSADDSPPPPDNHGLGFAFDAISAVTGLRVRYANGDPPRIDTLDALYTDVAQCMGISPVPAGPLLLIMTDARLAGPSDAFLHLDTGTIVIDAQVTTFDWVNPQPAIVAAAMRAEFRHEFVHYLLSRMGFPSDRNVAHDSPLFDSCGR